MIKFQEKGDLDGMNIKNILENGKIMNYLDMEFSLMEILSILVIFLIAICMDMELVFLITNQPY